MKTRRLSLTQLGSIGLLGSILLACTKPQFPHSGIGPMDLSPEESKSCLFGIVVDDQGLPVPEAKFELQAGSVSAVVQSDQFGRFIFRGINPGSWFLVASAAGHVARRISNSPLLEPNQTRPILVVLPRIQPIQEAWPTTPISSSSQAKASFQAADWWPNHHMGSDQTASGLAGHPER